jgi:hypothetical protein
MKKIILGLGIIATLVGCQNEVEVLPVVQVSEELKISDKVGIKLQTPFVTTEVAMNVKMDAAQTVTVRIFDIANRVVSKEVMNVKAGDNVLKVYTSALPSSAYRIALFDNNNKQLGVTDFNKL